MTGHQGDGCVFKSFDVPNFEVVDVTSRGISVQEPLGSTSLAFILLRNITSYSLVIICKSVKKKNV